MAPRCNRPHAHACSVRVRSADSLQVNGKRANLGWIFGSIYGRACMEIVLLAESIPMDVHPLVHVLS